MDELDYIELNSQNNLIEYFDLIKNEIKLSTANLIEQAIKYRDKLLSEIDYLKEQSFEFINDLFNKSSKLVEFRKLCNRKRNEWQAITKSQTNLNEPVINSIINEASLISVTLDEKKTLIQNSMSNKLVFNQREPNYLDRSSSLIGQLEFNEDSKLLIDHTLKIKHLNEIFKLKTVNYESSQLKQTVPMLFKRFLNVKKKSYDEFTDYELSIMDINGKVLNENKENYKCCINAFNTYLNYVLVSVSDCKTGRELLKMYNNSLEPVSSCFIEFKSNEIFMNDLYVYAKLESSYPFLLKFDYNLNKLNLFEKLSTTNSEVFLSFVVDKLVHISSDMNKLYFSDSCFSRIKIYSELNGDLLESIMISNLRDCSMIYVDFNLMNRSSEQFICVSSSDRLIRVYDTGGEVVSECKLNDEIKNVSEFYLTQDGSYVFIDDLNDSIYYYD